MRHVIKQKNQLTFAEHMEEDDPTLRALPRWVELEYNVSISSFSDPRPLGLTDEPENTIDR
jgi:hypothetical protein